MTTQTNAGDPLLQFFAYEHLRAELMPTSKMFADVANQVIATLPPNEERSMALRKLLEAKDCAVRARLLLTASAGAMAR